MSPSFINVAEAILDPLWDGALSGFARKRWTVAEGAPGLRVVQEWSWVQFSWAGTSAAGTALRMSRDFDADVASFDVLRASAALPRGCRLRLTAATDRGTLVSLSSPSEGTRREYGLPLEGARRLRGLTMEIESEAEGAASGWLNWIGLENTGLLAAHLRSTQAFDPAWEGLLQPASFRPAFEPAYGLVLTAEELEAMRRGRAGRGREMAAAALRLVPETLAGDHVNFWDDTRFCRERDDGRCLLGQNPEHGVVLAVAGVLDRDEEIVRHAARFALALAHCRHWDDGFVARFPGSAWEHRAFVASRCCYVIGTALDLAGEMFTPAGRELLLRRLSESGVGTVNAVAWRHEYLFGCNQMAWFSMGRMLAYAVLERHRPRVRPYAEIAYADLVENLDKTLLSDGGYVEGPVYFAFVAHAARQAFSFYARMRGQALEEVLPESLRRAEHLGAAFLSTDDAQDVVPICDSAPCLNLDEAAALASLFPRSAWVHVYRKAARRAFGKGKPGSLLAMALDAAIPESAPPLADTVRLPVMGIVASHRRHEGQPVKLFLMGNKAGAGHTHEDKGSFLLEFAGETLAADPGRGDYAHPLGLEYWTAQRHNMLVPTGTVERPRPDCPLDADIVPRVASEGNAFSAEADLTPGWSSFYQHWRRAWDSPHPGVLTITDDYALAQGDGVEFLWQTPHPVTVDEAGRRVVIVAARSTASVSVPDGCTVRVDSLSLIGTEKRWQRIAIGRPGGQGRLRIEVAWSLSRRG